MPGSSFADLSGGYCREPDGLIPAERRQRFQRHLPALDCPRIVLLRQQCTDKLGYPGGRPWDEASQRDIADRAFDFA